MFTFFTYLHCISFIQILILNRGQHVGSGTGTTSDSKERQLSGDGVGGDIEIRLKLGGFSGRASR